MSIAAIAQLIIAVAAFLVGLYLAWAAVALHIMSNGFTGRSTMSTPVLIILALACIYIAYLFSPIEISFKV